eukprot:6195860-Pleurochrysis_carterae.AAC.1
MHLVSTVLSRGSPRQGDMLSAWPGKLLAVAPVSRRSPASRSRAVSNRQGEGPPAPNRIA